MKGFLIGLVFWSVFAIADVAAFMQVDVDLRRSSSWYLLPGGGFVALARFGLADHKTELTH